MQYKDLIWQRYSARKFTGQKVEPDKVAALLDAAKSAPTACNNQPQRILVLDDAAALEKLNGCTRFGFGAPLVFIIGYDKKTAWVRKYDGHHSGEIDASIVTTQMTLMAADLGLGSCWVMSFDPAKLREVFHIPANIEPVAILPVGYPAADCAPAPGHDQCTDPGAYTVYNTY